MSSDHLAYNTDNPATIIAALEKTFAECSHAEAPLPGKPLRGAIYQLQATPTANIKDDVRASFTYDFSHYPFCCLAKPFSSTAIRTRVRSSRS